MKYDVQLTARVGVSSGPKLREVTLEKSATFSSHTFSLCDVMRRITTSNMRHFTTTFSIAHIHADARGPTPASQAAQPFMECRSTKQHSIHVNAKKPYNPKLGLC